jgi:hypothetical protein
VGRGNRAWASGAVAGLVEVGDIIGIGVEKIGGELMLDSSKFKLSSVAKKSQSSFKFSL